MNKTSLQQLISVLILAAPLLVMTLPSAAADEPKRDPSITIKPGAVFFTTQNTRFDQIFLYDPGNKTYNDIDPSWPTVLPQSGFAMNVYPTSGVLVNGKDSGYPATVIIGSWSDLSLGANRTSFDKSYLSPVQSYAYGPTVTFQYGWYTSYGSGGAAGAEFPIYLWGLNSATIPILQKPPDIYTNGPVAGCINDSALSGCFSGPGDIYQPQATITLGSGTHPTTNDPKLTVSQNTTLTIDRLEALRGTVLITDGGVVAANSANWQLKALPSVTLIREGKLLVGGDIVSRNNVIDLSGTSALEAGRIEISDAPFGIIPGLYARENSSVIAKSALTIADEQVIFSDGARLQVGAGGVSVVASRLDSLLAFVPGNSMFSNGNQSFSAAPVQITGPIVVEGNLIQDRKSRLVIEGTTLSANSLLVGPGGILTGADSVINTSAGTIVRGLFDPSGTSSDTTSRLGQVTVNGPFQLAKDGTMLLELMRPGKHDEVFLGSEDVGLEGKVKIVVLPSDSFSNRISERMTLFASAGGLRGKTLNFDYDTSGLEADLSLGLRVEKKNGGLYINASIFRLEPNDLERDIIAMKASARGVAQTSGKMASWLEYTDIIRGSIKYDSVTGAIKLDSKELAKEILNKEASDQAEEIANTWGLSNEYKIFDRGRSIYDSTMELAASVIAVPNTASALIGVQLKLGSLAFRRLEKLALLMANDPPDALYRQFILAEADSFKFPTSMISGSANESFSRWITQYASAEKFLAGALASIERFQGASSAGDVTAAILQGAAFDDYLAGYNSTIASLAVLDLEIASSINVSGGEDFQINENTLMFMRRELAKPGVRAEIIEALVAGGLTIKQASSALEALDVEIAPVWDGPLNYADVLRHQTQIYQSQITAVPELPVWMSLTLGLLFMGCWVRRQRSLLTPIILERV